MLSHIKFYVLYYLTFIYIYTINELELMLSQQIDPNYNWKSYSVWCPSEYRLLGWVKDNSNYWLGKQCGGEKHWPSAFLPMPLPEWTCQITKAYVNHIARVGPWSYLQISSLTWNCHKVEFAQSWCLFCFGSNLFVFWK